MPLSRAELKKGGTSCPVGLQPKRTQTPAKQYYGARVTETRKREDTFNWVSNVTRSVYPRLLPPGSRHGDLKGQSIHDRGVGRQSLEKSQDLTADM